MKAPALLLGALALALWACGDNTLDPLPLDISIAANRQSAAPGDTINFLVSAQGGSLLGVEIDYADGSNDLFATSGARTARITFKHAYSTTGAFQVQATVTDIPAGTKNATIQIAVN